MYSFGKRSLACLATIDQESRQVLNDAIKIMDFAVICGERNKEAQDDAYATGASKKQFPNSVHNQSPSPAFDLAPWPIDWNDSLAFARLAGIVQACAYNRGVKYRWGGDWDQDGQSNDQSFMDIGHFERVKSPATRGF